MDIHKPKPWRGLREFLKEYVIIVVGVLTALGAEQAVEWLHWRHEVHAARETLRADYKRVLRWAGERDGQSPCIARRLAELSDIVEAAAVGGRLPPLGHVVDPTRVPWTMSGWEGVISDQVLPHFPQDEARQHTSNSHYLDYMRGVRDEEVREWVPLTTLEGPGRRLEPGEAAALRLTLRKALRESDIMRLSSRGIAKQILNTRLLTREEAQREWTAGSDAGRVWVICRPIGPPPKGFLDNPNGEKLLAPPSTPF